MDNKLKLLRKEKGYRAEYVCEKLGISRTALYNYEEHRTELKAHRLIQFAQFYGCSVDTILGLKEVKP